MPEKIQRIIANSYFAAEPIYDSNIENGFYNGELDLVSINRDNIIQKEYASNCTFLGLNKAIVPGAFKSVTGPVYRQRGYSIMMNAIEYSGLLSALKRNDQELLLFALADNTLREDSSMFYNYSKANGIVNESFHAIRLAPSFKYFGLSQTDIRILLLNQIAIDLPKGIAKKEYLRTLGGNHLIWNNEENTVQGTSYSVFGYGGTSFVENHPVKISEDSENGDTYEIDAWFKFSGNEIFSKISFDFPDFHNLLVKAGYSLDKEYRYSFLSASKLYTIFVPSTDALQEIKADTLSGTNLENFVRLHFIEDDMIFTDGRLTPGYYKTACKLPINGTNRLENVSIYIDPSVDEIKINTLNGNNFLTVKESETSNLITAKSIGEEDTNSPNVLSTGVIHQIDKAFMIELLDIK
jgi:uncharacterized surface protein with fasciclin (FAS1) repeats